MQYLDLKLKFETTSEGAYLLFLNNISISDIWKCLERRYTDLCFLTSNAKSYVTYSVILVYVNLHIHQNRLPFV